MSSLADILPPSLLLPPHLSAHKYFYVCTLTVAAWDTLVLSPRAFRLFRSEGWPALKILFMFVRHFMPVVYCITAVAFFDTNWSKEMCNRFYLFEPICTAILLAANSAIHVLRLHGVYDKSRAVLLGLGALLGVQIVVDAISIGFFRPMPLKDGQGCIAGPKANWVGIYWVIPTVLYSITFVMALMRSFNSLQTRPLSLWKLMLRDGLNLYATVWAINVVNMFFWFFAKEDDSADTIKTIVTSLAGVLTTSMTMRIVLTVRGGLSNGGSFALSGTTSSTGHTSSRSGTTHVLSTNSARIGTGQGRVPTYNLDPMRSKPEAWDDPASPDLKDDKPGVLDLGAKNAAPGVKIAIDREVVYDDPYVRK